MYKQMAILFVDFVNVAITRLSVFCSNHQSGNAKILLLFPSNYIDCKFSHPPPPNLHTLTVLCEGWEKLTDAVIHWINDNLSHVVFLLWGAYAQKKGSFIDKVSQKTTFYFISQVLR